MAQSRVFGLKKYRNTIGGVVCLARFEVWRAIEGLAEGFEMEPAWLVMTPLRGLPLCLSGFVQGWIRRTALAFDLADGETPTFRSEDIQRSEVSLDTHFWAAPRLLLGPKVQVLVGFEPVLARATGQSPPRWG